MTVIRNISQQTTANTRTAQQNAGVQVIDVGPEALQDGGIVQVDISDDARQKLNQAAENTAVSLPGTLSDEEQAEVTELKARDREVRAHEQAHVNAGGSLVTKGASYGYNTGPDGIRYAVSGEVQIDITPVEDDPQATLNKMTQVQRAALAPIDPSSQDYAVAARASQLALRAQVELAQQRYLEQSPQSTSGIFLPGTN